MTCESVYAKTSEAQEAMLSRYPVKICRDGDSDEAVVLYRDFSLLSEAILECSPEPWVHQARDIYRGGRDEVIPDCALA